MYWCCGWWTSCSTATSLLLPLPSRKRLLPRETIFSNVTQVIVMQLASAHLQTPHINWSKAVLKTCLPLQTTAHLRLDNISFEDLCTLEDLILEGWKGQNFYFCCKSWSLKETKEWPVWTWGGKKSAFAFPVSGGFWRKRLLTLSLEASTMTCWYSPKWKVVLPPCRVLNTHLSVW